MCKLPFQVHPSSAAPTVFGCGHSVCKECADAMQNCIPPVCLLCRLPILTAMNNCALGEFAEQAADPGSDSDPDSAAAPLKRQRMAAPPPLAEQLDQFVHAAAALDQAADQAARAKDAVFRDTLACVDQFNLVVDRMLVQVEEYRERRLIEVQLLSRDREKALEAQIDLLAVSAGQLTACVALGRAALASNDDGRVSGAAFSAKAMKALLVVPTRLCTGTRLAVRCDLPAALACLEDGTQLQRFEVDAAQSSASGGGLVACVRGGAAHNVILVTCRDSGGMLADWATLEDADVGLTLNGVAWQVSSAVFTEPGVVQVTYVVVERGVAEVEVGVSLRGAALPGGPWRTLSTCLPQGVYVTTLPLRDARCNWGLAISSDGNTMVVSNVSTHQLSVYRTHDGSHVRSFGGVGMAAGQFRGLRGLCMTAHDTVLVVEWDNHRIQEVTLEGAHVKFIKVSEVAMNVAVHGDLVAASSLTPYIELFSYTTGAFIRKFESPERLCTGMCFAADGKCLALAGLYGPITLVSVEGQLLKYIGPVATWAGVAFTCSGDVVGLRRTGVNVFSATDGTLLRSWGTAGDGNGQFKYASALTASRNRLYILDGETTRVQVFE